MQTSFCFLFFFKKYDNSIFKIRYSEERKPELSLGKEERKEISCEVSVGLPFFTFHFLQAAIPFLFCTGPLLTYSAAVQFRIPRTPSSDIGSPRVYFDSMATAAPERLLFSKLCMISRT